MTGAPRIISQGPIIRALEAQGYDVRALRARYARLFPKRLGRVRHEDLTWFIQFVDMPAYERAVAALREPEAPASGAELSRVGFLREPGI